MRCLMSTRCNCMVSPSSKLLICFHSDAISVILGPWFWNKVQIFFYMSLFTFQLLKKVGMRAYTHTRTRARACARAHWMSYWIKKYISVSNFIIHHLLVNQSDEISMSHWPWVAWIYATSGSMHENHHLVLFLLLFLSLWEASGLRNLLSLVQSHDQNLTKTIYRADPCTLWSHGARFAQRALNFSQMKY